MSKAHWIGFDCGLIGFEAQKFAILRELISSERAVQGQSETCVYQEHVKS